MADNIPNSLRLLNDEMKKADANLKSYIDQWKNLGKGIKDAVAQGKGSLDEIYQYIASKKSQKDALKLKVIIDQSSLKDAKDKIENSLNKNKTQVKVFGEMISGSDKLKAKLEEIRDMLRLLPKTPAEQFDYINKLINGSTGKEGTAWSKALTNRKNAEKRAIDDITRKQKELIGLEEQLARYKEGGNKWKKTKAAIEAANKELKVYKERLDMLQGRSIKDNTEKSIKAQMDNMRQLYNLTKQYRQMQDQQRNGKVINPQDLEDTKRRLREILADMKRIEAEHPGSRKTAAARLETERLRDRWREVYRAMNVSNTGLDSLIPRVKRLATAFGTAFSIRTLVNFGKKIAEVRGEFEIQQRALQAIIQDKQKADEIWEKTMAAALQSPFTAMQLTKYTKQLAAYRIETEKLFDTTKRLADVSAGLGVDMQRLILAYGQVKAANYLRASEIRQFTEAGVNILGELRDYFNEVKGMSVDTAKVMDMVQKRLVTFGDVEVVFKRLTDQGGIFYNMQYIQSQTLKGQINKLHDAYDQMLNSIGKSNEGVLKGFVDTMNSIVKNWRTWAGVIKGIGLGSLTVYLIRLAKAMNILNVSGVKASKSISRFAASLRLFRMNLKANLGSLAVGGIVSLVAVLDSLISRMEEANKEIDEQILRLSETSSKMKDYKERIEKNNSVIQSGTKDQKKLNKAQTDNNAILQKLKDTYPDVASQMKIATNGIVDMNDALTINIRKLNEQMTLMAMAKQDGLFSDTMLLNEQEASSELASLKALLYAIKAENQLIMANYEIEGKTADAAYQKLVEFSKLNITDDVLSDVRIFMNELKKLEDLGVDIGEKGGLLAFRTGTIPSTNIRNVNAFKEQLKEQEDLILAYYQNGIKDNAEYMKTIDEQYSGDIIAFVKDNVDKLNKESVKGTNKANADIIKRFGALPAEMKTIINQELNKKLFGDELGKRMTDIGVLMAKGLSRGFSDEWKKDVEEKTLLAKIIDFFAEPESDAGGGGGGGDDKKNKIDAEWRRRISLLEEMRKRYVELSESAYGYAKSNEVVREEFGKAWDTIIGKSVSMSAIGFMNNKDMAAAYDMFLEAAKREKASDAIIEELTKKSGSEMAQIPIDLQVRIREDFGRQIEEAFGNYQLSLELDKLNLPPDTLSQMFEVPYTDLAEIRKRVVDFYNDMAAKGADPTKLFKQVEGYYKKIDEMERKQQRDRIKEYAKYLEYELSERAKIEMEYTRKYAEVMSMSNLTDAQKERITKRMRQESDKELAKKEWEEFKGSDTYVQMMEDLEAHGTGALRTMRMELERIKMNAENLSPRALKEVLNAIEKIDEIERKRMLPVEGMMSAWKGVRKAQQSAYDAGLTQEQVGSRSAAQEYADELEKQIIAKKSLLRSDQQIVGYEEEYTRLLAEQSRIRDNFFRITRESAVSVDENTLAKYRKELEDSNNALEENRRKFATADDTELDALNKEYAQLKTNNEIIQNKINYVKKELELRIAIAKVQEMRETDPEELERLKKEIAELEKQLKLLGKKKKAVDEVNEGYRKWAKAAEEDTKKIANWAAQAKKAAESFKKMMEALGIDTDTNGWDDFTSVFNTIDTVASTASDVVTKLANGDIVGAIGSGLTGLFDVISEWAGNNDKEYEREIQEQQRRINSLKDAYARLEKQIEKTFSDVDYMRVYNAELSNIYEQINATNKQIAAEEDKKNTDEDKLRDYKNNLQDLYDKLDEVKQKQLEVFGGIGEEGYRSAAEGFVDAWKQAFLETGDGLQGLQDHFDEFLQDWFTKQATMRIAGKMLENTFKMIDKSVSEGSDSGAAVTLAEIQAIRDEFAAQAPLISEALQNLAGVFDLQGEGGLSGLSAGIQGMTEEQANILEAYWNSVRIDTANIDQNVSRIADILGAGGSATNPQLQQLQIIAQHTQAIHTLLDNVTRSGHPQGGLGIKVFNN